MLDTQFPIRTLKLSNIGLDSSQMNDHLGTQGAAGIGSNTAAACEGSWSIRVKLQKPV